MDLKFLLEQTQLLKAQLDELRPLSADVEAKILQKLRLDWNYHSNHLEGGKLTYGETKALILFGLTAQGKPLQDHLETSGHDEAIKWIEDVIKHEYPLNESFIRQLHQLILKNPSQKQSITPDGKIMMRQINIGVYKTTPNHVITKTGETFRFASPEETPAMMNDLMNWYAEKRANETINPILFAAEFHYKFIRIHPFDDGNGRLARLLMNFILMQFGYPPAIIRTEDKENYYTALEQADAGILEPFVAYIAQSVFLSLEIMLKGARGENIEDPDDLDKQIALLDHKLNTADKIAKIKSKETLEEWCKDILPYLVSQFIETNEKFSRFYISKKFVLCPSFETIVRRPLFDKTRKDALNATKNETTLIFNRNSFSNAITQKYSKIIEYLLANQKEYLKILCEYNAFTRNVLNPFDYELGIRILFYKAQYSIVGQKSRKTLSKLYNQKPSSEELNYVLQAEAQAHLAFIDEKTSATDKTDNLL